MTFIRLAYNHTCLSLILLAQATPIYVNLNSSLAPIPLGIPVEILQSIKDLAGLLVQVGDIVASMSRASWAGAMLTRRRKGGKRIDSSLLPGQDPEGKVLEAPLCWLVPQQYGMLICLSIHVQSIKVGQALGEQTPPLPLVPGATHRRK